MSPTPVIHNPLSVCGACPFHVASVHAPHSFKLNVGSNFLGAACVLKDFTP